ncbi:MAG: hypothetical protein WC223_00870 [Bacteroidales bacterium]|jgi:hypothetical protein
MENLLFQYTEEKSLTILGNKELKFHLPTFNKGNSSESYEN